MKAIERRLYSAAQVRELESRHAQRPLMRRAARAAWDDLRRAWPEAFSLGIVCGPGNNGGDGYGVAALALKARRKVRLWQFGAAPAGGAAAQMRAAFKKAGGKSEPWSPRASFAGCDLLVDALFGIGLNRALEAEARELVQRINDSGLPVLALDIPTGLHADTGAALGGCVRAQRTLTFIALKSGLLQNEGPGACGEIVLADLGVKHTQVPEMTRMHADDLAALLPRRARTAHKGDHGHVLVVGGDHGMMGAALLAARGALRAGAGWVSVATRAAHAVAMAAAQPELMCHGIEDARELKALIARADVIALGPGLGPSEWGRALFAGVLDTKTPLVVDADGLNWLARNRERREHWVLTPHPGEAARLLGADTRTVQRDRAAAARALQQRYGGVALLKGAGSLVCDGALQLCPYGNPGMAVGGMGDVLSGVIAALMAQGLPAAAAARAGVLAHALAGDTAAVNGERGLLPSDVLAPLRKRLNP